MIRRLILNEAPPQDLWEALQEAAEEENVTVNDYANSILAKHYGLHWKRSGFPYREPASERFKLRVPEELHRAIRLDAAERLLTVRGLALNILSTNLGTSTVNPQRRPRREVV